jgi:hypothetical protein
VVELLLERETISGQELVDVVGTSGVRPGSRQEATQVRPSATAHVAWRPHVSLQLRCECHSRKRLAPVASMDLGRERSASAWRQVFQPPPRVSASTGTSGGSKPITWP